MPDYRISVLCRDGEGTCRQVKEEMGADYRIGESPDKANFDHVGIRSFESQEHALEAAKLLKAESDGKILAIAVSPT